MNSKTKPKCQISLASKKMLIILEQNGSFRSEEEGLLSNPIITFFGRVCNKMERFGKESTHQAMVLNGTIHVSCNKIISAVKSLGPG